MNDETNTDTRARAHAHTRGSGLRPSEDVLLSEELRNINAGERPSSTENAVGRPTTDGQRQIHDRTTPTLGATARALQMMRERGVDDAESLLNCAEPQAIIRTCQWFDRQSNAKKGLLVWKIRAGGIPEKDTPVSRSQTQREIFDRYIQAHPVGSQLCSHIALATRKWPNDKVDCSGQMMVVAATIFPVLRMECNMCTFEATLTPRAMKGMV